MFKEIASFKKLRNLIVEEMLIFALPVRLNSHFSVMLLSIFYQL